jgi:2-polyprenyl-6-methoxyphenol hydroxylase-like FAD-dependent oxidoreductase
MTGVKSVKFVCYPIADTDDGSLLNWVADLAMLPETKWRQQDWNREGRLEDFLPQFDGWSFDWLDIPKVIRGAEAVYEFPIVDREPLDRWTHGRMTLLGDAAHAMYPIGSNGASQGILDARILGRCLRDHGVTPQALAAYDDVRREEVNAVVLANRGDGPDKILDIVAERAPEGFDRIEDVISQEDLARAAGAYKAVAGMDIATLNARPPIL